MRSLWTENAEWRIRNSKLISSTQFIGIINSSRIRWLGYVELRNKGTLLGKAHKRNSGGKSSKRKTEEFMVEGSD